jgi:hypothetical protein
MMDRPTCSAETALEQAGMTLHQYLGQAERAIDHWFGKGYAKKNPGLVSACVAAQVQDFNHVSGLVVAYAISDSLRDIADAIERLPVINQD